MMDFSKYIKYDRPYFSSDNQYNKYITAFSIKSEVFIDNVTTEFKDNKEHWAVEVTRLNGFWLDVFETKEEAIAFCNHFGFSIKKTIYRD